MNEQRMNELLEFSLAELLDRFEGSKDRSHVYLIYGSGAAFQTKGGSLLFQRTLHEIGSPLTDVPNLWDMRSGRDLPPMSCKAQDEDQSSNYRIIESELGCRICRLKMLQILVENEKRDLGFCLDT